MRLIILSLIAQLIVTSDYSKILIDSQQRERGVAKREWSEGGRERDRDRDTDTDTDSES